MSCCGRSNPPVSVNVPARRGGRGYVYVDENGKETVKATEVEAMAMKVRAGHKGEVRPR